MAAPVPVDRKLLRTWIRRLSDAQPLSFKDAEELNLLIDMYDANEVHPVQYHFDSRFKERLVLPDPALCSTAQMHAKRSRTNENYPTDEGLLPFPDGEFINASIIEGRDRQYIATQHPLPSTTLDFWKMVLVEKPCAIIMLNKYDFDQALEGNSNQPELVQYWPGDNPKTGFIDTLLLEDKVSGGVVKVTVVDDAHHKIEELVVDGEVNSMLESVSTPPSISPVPSPVGSPVTSPVSVRVVSSTSTSDPPVLNLDSIPTTSPTVPSSSLPLVPAQEKDVEEEKDPSPPPSPPMTPCDSSHSDTSSKRPHKAIECSKLRVEYQGEVHEVWHIRCASWKDQDAPDLDMFMDLWRLVEEKVRSHAHAAGQKHKLIVHCTGGVGRTGTFITIDIAGQELKARMKETHTEEFSVEKIIQFLRSKRMNMVGSIPQYVFCHRAALKVLSEHLGGEGVQ